MLLRALFMCVVLFTQGNSPDATRIDRAARHLTLEVLMVADYSVYNKWYELTSHSSSHTARDNEAKHNIKEYLAALIHSSNNVYKSLESHNIYITLKLVDVEIMTTRAASPWTETTKTMSSDGEYLVDPEKALALFKPKSIELQSTIPHDHAMIVTQYSLAHPGGSSFAEPNDCRKERIVALEQEADNPDAGIFLPNCTPEGKWTRAQCHKSTGYCWCVEENSGRPISGTTTKGVDPKCDFEGEREIQGFANTEASCKPRGVSIATDGNSMYTASLMAHEIGHSLGAHHDGDRNTCDENGGYVMNKHFILANKKKWIFSSCSATAINNYLHDIDSRNSDCLTTTNNHHPDHSLVVPSNEWYGQLYSFDEQCRLHYGQQSYLCRNQYDGDYSNVCLKMYCYNPTKDGCYYKDGGDGSPCGSGKWCMSNECVSTSHVSSSVSDSCAAGDQPGVAYHGHTCEEIRTTQHHDCTHSHARRVCCDACSAHPSHMVG